MAVIQSPPSSFPPGIDREGITYKSPRVRKNAGANQFNNLLKLI
jgi:hypothetical protein